VAPNYAERLLLLQALIVRRVPTASRIKSVFLMEALQADEALVKKQTPLLHFKDRYENISQEVTACVGAGLIDDGSIKVTKRRRVTGNCRPIPITYKRTALGDQFLNTLEPGIQADLDSMPMSDVGILDFLSLL